MGVLRNFAKFTGKHLCQSLFFNKGAGLRPVVTLIIVFVNIYRVFRPITLLKHKLITNQYVAQNYCLFKRVINTLRTLLG